MNVFQRGVVDFFEIKPPEISDTRAAALHIGFYLGSWGMFRNSDLLNYGIEKYELLAEELKSLNEENYTKPEEDFKKKYEGLKSFLTKFNVDGIKENLEEINSLLGKIQADEKSFDVENNLSTLLKEKNILEMGKDDISKIINKCESLRKDLKKYIKENSDKKDSISWAKKLSKELITTPSITLITKIMLGVYANAPAIDRFFKMAARDYCGINFYNTDSAENVFDKIKIVKYFIETEYKKASHNLVTEEKILDAIFFQLGKDLYENGRKTLETITMQPNKL